MREVYRDGHWRIVEESAALPDGRSKTITRAHRADGVHVIAFVDAERILLLREFRPFYGDYVWMLPSGHADKEADRAEGAQRELREETGFRARELRMIGSARASEMIAYENHFYVARGLEPAPLPQDPDECIEVHDVPLAEALRRILGSSEVHMPSAYALLLYMEHERS